MQAFFYKQELKRQQTGILNWNQNFHHVKTFKVIYALFPTCNFDLTILKGFKDLWNTSITLKTKNIMQQYLLLEILRLVFA